jgi:hypothetical protein
VRLTPRLLSAEVIEGYVVRVRFEDGTEGDIDLSYLVEVGPVFARLEDGSYFRKVRVSRNANTVVWPNGADIAPETLYARAREVATTPA